MYLVFALLFTFVAVLWVQIKRAKNVKKLLGRGILSDRDAFDLSILGNNTIHETFKSEFISKNVQLYLIWMDGKDAKVVSLNDSVPQYISAKKYYRLRKKLSQKMLVSSYFLSPSIYYQLGTPNDKYILWVFNY